MQIIKGRVNGIENPVGYLLDNLTFSYQVEDAKGKKQEEARICIYEESLEHIVYDTTWSKEINNVGTELELSLKPYTRYLWKVMVRSDIGEEAESELYYFETAKGTDQWNADWIGCDMQESRHPIFFKNFTCESPVKRARLYICGLGLYEAELNGNKIGEEKLTPYCNNYEEWLQYQTYDVTEALKRENVLEVTLAPGWYMGRFGYASRPGDKGHYGDQYKLIAELHLTYADGSKKTIVTDDTWKVRRSNILFSNIYDGEQVDDTLEVLPEEDVCYVEEKTPLVERMSVPMFVQETLKAKELIYTPAGEWVYDLGQNFSGGFRLKVKEPKGTKIHIQVGEILQHGNFYRDNLRTAKAEYIYISDGEEHVLEPRFTYYGYRYAKVSGVTNPQKQDFVGLAYYSVIDAVGTLEIGSEKVNQLISNIKWGQKGNFLDVPTDCPQRDERMGWTADTQVFVPTASYFTDSYAFYRKYMYDIRTEQIRDHGLVPYVVPSFHVHTYCSVWGDAACIIPWMLYVFYGREQILSDSYESMKAWDGFIDRVDGDHHGWSEGTFHFGDWLALDNPNIYNKNEGGTDTAFIAEVYRFNNLQIIAKTARILHKKEEAEAYQQKAERLLERIRAEFFTPNGRISVNTQTAYVLALYYDIAPDRQRMVKELVDSLRNNGNKIKTGFVGTPLICRVLSAEGYDDLAYEILLNEEYPGWLYVVGLGATTIWERWNSVNPDGTISSLGMNSLNHYAYGSIGEWMWQTIAGMKPLEEMPGFKKVILRPIPNYKLGWANAEYHSAAGTYKVSWKVLDENKVWVRVVVPFDCEAVLQLPYAKDMEREIQLASGEYEFTYETEKTLIKRWTLETPLVDIMTNPKLHAEMIRLTSLAKRPANQLKPMNMRELLETYEAEYAKEKLPLIEALLQKYNNLDEK